MTLQVLGLCYTRGVRTLFANIQFELQAGEALLVSGVNGGGKTSLLRLLAGLALPQEGSVLWQGRNIRSCREDYQQSLFYHGHAQAIKDDLCSWENLFYGASLVGRSCTKMDAQAALEQAGLGKLADLPVRVLSQGQRKRVALARAFLHPRPRLLLLDEPFSALDQVAIDSFTLTLNSYLEQGGIVVYSTHQPVLLHARKLHALELKGHA